MTQRPPEETPAAGTVTGVMTIDGLVDCELRDVVHGMDRCGDRAKDFIAQSMDFHHPGFSRDFQRGSVRRRRNDEMTPKNTICLWFENDALEAARFYASTFPDSEVTAVRKAPADYPGGKAGDVLTIEFTVVGIPCIAINGGPAFPQSEAFSFQIATEDQEETDRYWNAIVSNGGQESQCGWCKDRWGLSWQITPRTLTDAMAAGGDEAKRAFEAMLQMKKIDVAAIDAARRG
jgi:predicted 3-demethylubiquinone-9 3-methyltransferase (glyoxalase superfamily)